MDGWEHEDYASNIHEAKIKVKRYRSEDPNKRWRLRRVNRYGRGTSYEILSQSK